MPDTGDYKSGWELDRDWKLKEDKDKMDALQASPSKAVVKRHSGAARVLPSCVPTTALLLLY